MIERYVEILKEKKRYRYYGVTELAHHGSQSAFDALLELKRQLDFGEINLNHIGINPYIELLELTDRGMIKENYENFKLYLNKIISSFPLYGFLYSTYFLEEYNGFLCQTNNDQKIELARLYIKDGQAENAQKLYKKIVFDDQIRDTKILEEAADFFELQGLYWDARKTRDLLNEVVQ